MARCGTCLVGATLDVVDEEHVPVDAELPTHIMSVATCSWSLRRSAANRSIQTAVM